MDGLQARLQSFKKSKRVKNPTKSSNTTLKWPHPQDFIANPATLAEAGFYYDPSYDDLDNVTCFNCEKQLAGWEEDDDPYLIHWNKCAKTCCWAVVQCGLRADTDPSGRFVFPDKTRLPNHKTMEKARLETFILGKGWIHDKTRNHGANSKSMARAGFVYTPHETGDDLASCLYCNVSLSGWDDDDDPMEEHRKRASKSDTNCPFFEHTEPRQTKPPKLPSKSTSKPPSRTTSRSKYQDVLVPTKTFDGEMESQSQSDIPSNTKSTTHGLGAKTPAKPRSRSRTSSAKTPAAKSRSVSRSGLKNVAEEVGDEEKVTEPPPTVKKKTRSAPKSVAKSEAPTESEIEPATEPPPTVKKKTRSGSKSVVKSEAPTPSDIDDEVEKPAVAPPTTKKKSRTTSKSMARSEAMIQSESEDEVTTTRRPTRSRGKSKAPVEVEKEEEGDPIRKSSRSKSKVAADTKDDEIAPPRKTSRKGSKPKAVQEDLNKADVAQSALGVKRTTSHKRTGSRSRPKSPETKSDVEEAITTVTTTTIPTHAKTNPQSQSRPEIDDLFNDDIVPVEEYVPPPPPPSTTNQLPLLFIPKRTKDKPKPANKVVEISSDEEEVEKKEPQISSETKTQTVEPVPVPTAGSPSFVSAVNGVKDSEHHDFENRRPIEHTMDVSMHDPGTQETVTEQELHTAPSTPPKPISRSEDVGRSHTSETIPQTPNDKPAEAQSSVPSSNTTLPLTAKPVYLPPLSRLPFMPLESLNEAELDMTVEEWIRYQIEVEQDRFKRDGERELERFKKRAEEVRNAIESL